MKDNEGLRGNILVPAYSKVAVFRKKKGDESEEWESHGVMDVMTDVGEGLSLRLIDMENGRQLITTTVHSATIDGNNIVLETDNSLYELRVVKQISPNERNVSYVSGGLKKAILKLFGY